jgi:hypothetical protein
MSFWDKARQHQRTSSFIAQLKVWQAEDCYYFVVPFTPNERKRMVDVHGARIKVPRCSQCHRPRGDAAPLYTIVSTISFQDEILAALEASSSEAEFNYRSSRLAEQETIPMVCRNCCPCKAVHDHGIVHAFSA